METKEKQTEAEYRYWYNRGWRYSNSETCQGLDHLDVIHAPDAMYDGYMDAAAGRDKWHTRTVDGVTFYPVPEKGAWYENGEDKIGNLIAPMLLDGSFDPDEIGEIEVRYEDA